MVAVGAVRRQPAEGHRRRRRAVHEPRPGSRRDCWPRGAWHGAVKPRPPRDPRGGEARPRSRDSPVGRVVLDLLDHCDRHRDLRRLRRPQRAEEVGPPAAVHRVRASTGPSTTRWPASSPELLAPLAEPPSISDPRRCRPSTPTGSSSPAATPAGPRRRAAWSGGTRSPLLSPPSLPGRGSRMSVTAPAGFRARGVPAGPQGHWRRRTSPSSSTPALTFDSRPACSPANRGHAGPGAVERSRCWHGRRWSAPSMLELRRRQLPAPAPPAFRDTHRTAVAERRPP